MPTSLVEDIAYKKSALVIQKTERMLIAVNDYIMKGKHSAFHW